MSVTPADPTIESAVVALATARKYRDADRGFGHATAARVQAGVALPEDTRRRAWRLLPSYTDELSALGVDVTALPEPGTNPARDAAQAAAQAAPIGRSRVWVADGHLWLAAPFSARQIVKELPATWSPRRRAYQLPATPMSALAIADALGRYGIDADPASTALVQQAHAGRSASAKRTATDLPPVPGSKTDAWGHQRQAFWFARELQAAVLDMEMGTGKSKVVCDLVHDAGARSVLITCPERVVGVWPKQFGLHCGGEKHIIDPRRQKRTGGWELIPIKARIEQYEWALHECDCGLPHVLMSNYAAAGQEAFRDWSLRQSFDYLVYDESHRLRSHSGVWSKHAAKMMKRGARRLGGTGTFQAQTPMDVFGQLRAIEPGLFGTSFFAFQKKYALMGGFEGREFKGMNPDREAEFAAKIASVTYRAGEEVLDLPELMPDVTVTGQLSPRAMKAYRALEQDLFAEVQRTLEDGTVLDDEVTVDNVLVKILRCQQITGGALPLDSGAVEEIDTSKRELLADELEDLPEREPVVVFCRFHHDLDQVQRVADKLGRPYAELSGRRDDALAHDATLADDVVIAGVQIQSGGTGVDFTRAAYGIYYSVGHSLADYLQSRKRLHRPGQVRPVRFRHLVMNGTIDEDVYAALAARESVTRRIGERVRALQAAGR